MDDISPGLLEQIRGTFGELIGFSPKIRALEAKIAAGTATYVDADKYADQIGTALSKALQRHLTADVLPDGRMYYNIAQKVLEPMLGDDYELVSAAVTKIQTSLNKAARIGLAVQRPPIDMDRVQGLLDKISNAESFDTVSWLLGAPINNFSMHIVDDYLQKNVEFQGRAGLGPKITRTAERRCCKWCTGLAGVYSYPDLPDEIYQRHDNCRCTVEYDPGDGRRQNVHTKRWR